VLDIACWWLARESEAAGPYFAMAVVGTGGLVGTGLALQIVLSLFSMYGKPGKLVLFALLAAGAGLGGAVYVTVIHPALKEKRAENGNGNGQAAKSNDTTDKKDPPVTPAGKARLELLKLMVDGKPVTPDKLLKPDGTLNLPWDGKEPNGMVRAFFDKDGADFKKVMKGGKPEEKQALLDERDGERQAVIAWMKAEAAAQKKAYDDDKFPLPAELAGRPLTADYKDGGAAKIKTILNDRCARCHTAGAEKEDAPLDSYEGVLQYLLANGPKAEAKAPAAAPIPAARE
jgi:hypothetical protein